MRPLTRARVTLLRNAARRLRLPYNGTDALTHRRTGSLTYWLAGSLVLFLLGAMVYFPIILNICVLSFAVRFDGSLFTAPLMVLACLYLFFWDAHKLKPLFTAGDRNR